MSLTLTLDTLTVTISRLRDPKLPRAIVNPATNEFTAKGYPVLRGSSVQTKQLWSVGCRVFPEEYDILKAIYEESDLRRRELVDPAILVFDTWQRFSERAPRTRAIAPSTSEILLSPQVQYYAQFNAWFTKPPEIINSSQGRFWDVDFDLTELETVVA